MASPSAAAAVVLLVVAQVGGGERRVDGAAPAAGAQVALRVRGDGVVELEHRVLHLVLHGLHMYTSHSGQACTSGICLGSLNAVLRKGKQGASCNIQA